MSNVKVKLYLNIMLVIQNKSNTFRFQLYKNNSPLPLLTDDDEEQISEALSFIWTKLQYRLKTIVIDGSSATLTYGRRTDRIHIRLKDNNNLFNDKDLEVRFFFS